MNAEEIKQTVQRSRDLQHEARSYPQDLADLDRGNYCVICQQCKQPFQGFKRRATCRLCMESYYKKTIEAQAEEIRLLREVLEAEDKLTQFESMSASAGGSRVIGIWLEKLKERRSALSAFDSTRDKGEG